MYSVYMKIYLLIVRYLGTSIWSTDFGFHGVPTNTELQRDGVHPVIIHCLVRPKKS